MPEVKDSGERYVNANGGQRDISEGKPNFKYVPFEIIKLMYQMNKDSIGYVPMIVIESLCLDITVNKETEEKVLQNIIYSMLMIIGEGNVYDGLKQFALFMERCAKKYSYNNWVLLDTEEDFERFTISIGRHATQALFEQTDEFHREAVVFNAMCLLLNFETEEEGE